MLRAQDLSSISGPASSSLDISIPAGIGQFFAPNAQAQNLVTAEPPAADPNGVVGGVAGSGQRAAAAAAASDDDPPEEPRIIGFDNSLPVSERILVDFASTDPDPYLRFILKTELMEMILRRPDDEGTEEQQTELKALKLACRQELGDPTRPRRKMELIQQHQEKLMAQQQFNSNVLDLKTHLSLDLVPPPKYIPDSQVTENTQHFPLDKRLTDMQKQLQLVGKRLGGNKSDYSWDYRGKLEDISQAVGSLRLSSRGALRALQIFFKNYPLSILQNALLEASPSLEQAWVAIQTTLSKAHSRVDLQEIINKKLTAKPRVLSKVCCDIWSLSKLIHSITPGSDETQMINGARSHIFFIIQKHYGSTAFNQILKSDASAMRILKQVTTDYTAKNQPVPSEILAKFHPFWSLIRAVENAIDSFNEDTGHTDPVAPLHSFQSLSLSDHVGTDTWEDEQVHQIAPVHQGGGGQFGDKRGFPFQNRRRRGGERRPTNGADQWGSTYEPSPPVHAMAPNGKGRQQQQRSFKPKGEHMDALKQYEQAWRHSRQGQQQQRQVPQQQRADRPWRKLGNRCFSCNREGCSVGQCPGYDGRLTHTQCRFCFGFHQMRPCRDGPHTQEDGRRRDDHRYEREREGEGRSRQQFRTQQPQQQQQLFRPGPGNNAGRARSQ